MSTVSAHVSMSIDGLIAGPDQSRDDPIGRGGISLHTWHLERVGAHEADVAATDELLRPMGAYVMGRNMFGPIRGEWSQDWRGWWGDDPPYHAPVFVLTHHPRESVEMAGGTTFHFVTDGFDAALAMAKDVAGDDDVRIAGGASTLRQALRAGAIDELILDVAPVVLGTGESIFTDVGEVSLTQLEVTHSPIATHIRYRVGWSAPAHRPGLPTPPARYRASVAQWRIELSTQDVVALSRGTEITVTAVDEEQDLPDSSIEVTVSLLDL